MDVEKLVARLREPSGDETVDYNDRLLAIDAIRALEREILKEQAHADNNALLWRAEANRVKSQADALEALAKELAEAKAEDTDWNEAVQGEYNRAEHHRKHRFDAESRLSEMEKEVERLRAGGHICGLPEFGTYEGQVILAAPEWLTDKFPNGIGIDVCLALEIQNLWSAGIHTSGHCCGHGRADAFISVWPEFVGEMHKLGYATYPHPDGRDDHFVPLTRFAARRLVEGDGK